MYRPGGCQKALASIGGVWTSSPFALPWTQLVLVTILMDHHHRRLLWSMRFIWHHQWICDSWGMFVKMSPVWASVHRKRSIPVRRSGFHTYGTHIGQHVSPDSSAYTEDWVTAQDDRQLHNTWLIWTGVTWPIHIHGLMAATDEPGGT